MDKEETIERSGQEGAFTLYSVPRVLAKSIREYKKPAIETPILVSMEVVMEYINKIRKSDLRHALGIVLQDTDLFTGTVMENIRYGKLDATDEECIGAARLAGADDFITRLPKGYDTLLSGNGANLSQGQRQLFVHCPEGHGCAYGRADGIRHCSPTVNS